MTFTGFLLADIDKLTTSFTCCKLQFFCMYCDDMQFLTLLLHIKYDLPSWGWGQVPYAPPPKSALVAYNMFFYF